MVPGALFVAPQRVERREVGQVPARAPALTEVSGETDRFLGRGIGEVEAAASYERRRLLLEGGWEDAQQRALARDRHGPRRLRQAIAVRSEQRGHPRRPDQQKRIVQPIGPLDRGREQRRGPFVIVRQGRREA